MISFVNLKLWLVKVVKSDVRVWRVFAEPVTYIATITTKLACMGSCFGLISIRSAKGILRNRANFSLRSSLEHQLISATCLGYISI